MDARVENFLTTSLFYEGKFLGSKDADNYTLATLTNMEEMIDIIKKKTKI